MIDRLINIISREAAAFDRYLTLLEQQQQALVANDLTRLNAVTAEQRQVVADTQALHREREETIEQLRAGYDIEGDLTLSRLLELVDDTQATQLTRLQQLILTLNEQIGAVRNSNALLLNQSRESIARMMSMLSKIHHPDKTYSRPGGPAQSEAAMAVDRRA
ncbi:hypothetical protein GF420_12135 [candidate division GN15 bacterium]|nr:hypothetical protein [candidate division GN15 bacterium]